MPCKGIRGGTPVPLKLGEDYLLCSSQVASICPRRELKPPREATLNKSQKSLFPGFAADQPRLRPTGVRQTKTRPRLAVHVCTEALCAVVINSPSAFLLYSSALNLPLSIIGKNSALNPTQVPIVYLSHRGPFEDLEYFWKNY